MVNFYSVTASTDVQDNPKIASTHPILNDGAVAAPKSVIIDALVKSTDSLPTATVATLSVETTTEDDEEDDDEYGQPEVDNGLSGACVASLCGIGK
ncbi:unnamed protein product [Diamesa hyperborea]